MLGFFFVEASFLSIVTLYCLLSICCSVHSHYALKKILKVLIIWRNDKLYFN